MGQDPSNPSGQQGQAAPAPAGPPGAPASPASAPAPGAPATPDAAAPATPAPPPLPPHKPKTRRKKIRQVLGGQSEFSGTLPKRKPMELKGKDGDKDAKLPSLQEEDLRAKRWKLFRKIFR